MVDAGSSASDPKTAGYNRADLKAGFNLADTTDAGFSATDPEDAGFSLAAPQVASSSIVDLKLRTSALPIWMLRASALTISRCGPLPYRFDRCSSSLADLKAADTARPVSSCGLELADPEDAGVNATDL
jgi:hypothetical protein